MMNNKQHLKRKGAIWPLLLACLVLVLAGVALAVDSSLLWQARQELQVAADASALGAVLELADDQLLRRLPGDIQQAAYRAMQVAGELSTRHHVLGVPLQLETQDQADPDVRLGFYDPALGYMQPAYGDLDHPLLSAVEVIARRTRERGTPVGLFFTRLFSLSSADVSASATAVIDRNITGFRALPQINVPLIPIALLSDPSGIEEESWEAQIEKPLSQHGGGMDLYAFDKVTRQWKTAGQDASTGDGLPEFTLKLPLGEDATEANGTPLHWGKHGSQTIVRQIEHGLSSIDLQATQGQIELAWDGLLPIEQTAMPGGRQLETMIDLLNRLHESGEARIWPLYVEAENNDDQPGARLAMIRGFVAARIAAVEKTESYLEITLQPSILITGTAVTSPSGSANPYIGKVKLIR